MIYKLKTPFEYGEKGEMKEAKDLHVTAPNNRVLHEVSIIEKVVYKAFSDVSKDAVASAAEETTKKATDLKGSDVITAMLVSGADLRNCYDAFKKILLAGACKVNNEAALNEVLYNKMNTNDTKGLLGEYIVNFMPAFQED